MNKMHELEDRYEAKLQEIERLQGKLKAAEELVKISKAQIMLAERELDEINEEIIKAR